MSAAESQDGSTVKCYRKLTPGDFERMNRLKGVSRHFCSLLDTGCSASWRWLLSRVVYWSLRVNFSFSKVFDQLLNRFTFWGEENISAVWADQCYIVFYSRQAMCWLARAVRTGAFYRSECTYLVFEHRHGFYPREWLLTIHHRTVNSSLFNLYFFVTILFVRKMATND